ncbi:M56 family metallopeptidase [Streptomyces sp. NPDC006309]|uniref:M56 family metallopeptidase n=1 Tax=Streptomyces sp. NPDC006309 TaxID=3156749 RepID=UPI0033BF1D45
MLWQALMVSFIVSVALAWCHANTASQHLHGLLGTAERWISGPHIADPSTEDESARGAEGIELLVPIGLTTLWPASWFVTVSLSARRRRRRHARLLDLAGRPVPELGVMVLDHDTPAAYCLPGRPGRVVVTSAALRSLTPAQLQAVLAHERAHLTGRHHLVSATGEAFARAFRVLPLARTAREHMADLLEMVCDDHALRSASARTLAEAMCEVAAGGSPQSTFAAGGTAVLARLRRLLRPSAPLSRAARWAIVLLGAGAAALPYFITCGPVLG